MKAEEIMRMINKRGAVANEIFFTCASLIEEDDETESVKDAKATLVYNCTIKGMKIILDNPSFYEERAGIKERNRKRMVKDLEIMSPIEFEDDAPILDYERLENAMIKSL